MKTIINNTIALAATLVLSVFLITFCTQTVENPEGEDAIDKLGDALQEFKTVGLLHNKIMDEVLDDFRIHDGRFEDKEGYFVFLEESLVRNLSSKDLLQVMKVDDIRALVVEELDQTRTLYQAKMDNTLESESIFQSLVSQYEGLLSPKQIDILRRIEHIIDNAFTVEEMIISLEMVNNSPEVLSLSYEDRLVIYAATSVGIESAIYWSANFGEWVEVLIYNEFSGLNYQKISDAGFFDSVQWFRGRKMIKADVGGGVVGAVTGCMGGLMLGGVGCGPGAATGGLIGSVGASVGNAVSQILNNYFPD